MSAQEGNGTGDTPEIPQTEGQQPVQPGDARSARAEQALDALGALQTRLEDLEARNAELQEQVLRALADADNTRRRSQEDVAKARKFGIEGFAESLVPVKDSLEAALSQDGQDAQAWKEGVEATLKQLVQAFERNQLKEVAPAAGDKFDPNVHQAISSVPAEQPANTVVQTLQKGYTIADRVLRPALVTVAS